VVLKAGKHLTEREAENERRKEKGLPPIPEPVDPPSNATQVVPPEKGKLKEKAPSLSFSSSRGRMKSSKLSTGKRKVIGDTEDGESKDTVEKPTKKKSKKAGKSLLSFGDGEDV